MFDWKSRAQTSGGYAAQAGFTLSRVHGTIIDSFSALWAREAASVEVLATDYGPDRGWTARTDHHFRVAYESDRIRIEIDDSPIFDVSGSFAAGRFGFYNFSQAQVLYADFVAHAAPNVSME